MTKVLSYTSIACELYSYRLKVTWAFGGRSPKKLATFGQQRERVWSIIVNMKLKRRLGGKGHARIAEN